MTAGQGDTELEEFEVTNEEFDSCLDAAEPALVVDWMEDDTMPAEETLRRFEGLHPKPTEPPPAMKENAGHER